MTLTPIGIGIFTYDPIPQIVINTLYIGYPNQATLSNSTNMTVNADGNPVTVDNQSKPQAIAEFDRFTRRWNRSPLPASTPNSAGLAGCEWDALSGGILFASWGPPTALYRTSPDGQSISLVAQHASSVAGYGGTLVDSGDWISSSRNRPHYFVVKGGIWSTVQTPGVYPMDVTHEKFAAPGTGVWVASWNSGQNRGSIHHIDVVRNAVSVVFTGNTAIWPKVAYEITPLWDRDLSTLRTGKATWNLVINPGNRAFMGQTFIVAASLASPPPGGLKLPDGREIYLGLDALASLTAAGPVPPFLKGNTGTLTITGKAWATLDFSSVGTTANGVVVHFCGVVLDTNAPSGVSWVTDPHAFVVNVLP